MDCLLYKKWLSRVGQSMKPAKSQIVWRICVCSNYVTSVGVCQLTDINSLLVWNNLDIPNDPMSLNLEIFGRAHCVWLSAVG